MPPLYISAVRALRHATDVVFPMLFHIRPQAQITRSPGTNFPGRVFPKLGVHTTAKILALESDGATILALRDLSVDAPSLGVRAFPIEKIQCRKTVRECGCVMLRGMEQSSLVLLTVPQVGQVQIDHDPGQIT